MVVGLGMVAAVTHWSELSQNVLDRVLLPENLLMMWLVFPLSSSSATSSGTPFAVKARGGEVHEMGVMILVLTPVPYVDASAAWAFRSKWQRFAVGGAGMMVELFIASIALFLWLAVEPGMFRALLYNIMLIAGISTVIFNANPLLRFDGYYMLMDWLEIPNLRTRGTQYVVYLCEKYLFKRREAEPPISSAGRAGMVRRLRGQLVLLPHPGHRRDPDLPRRAVAAARGHLRGLHRVRLVRGARGQDRELSLSTAPSSAASVAARSPRARRSRSRSCC